MLTRITEAMRRRRSRAQSRRQHLMLLDLEDHRLADIGMRRDDLLARLADA
jgi:uncharacterized protein YjiS (DUF1127 family)